MGFGWAGTWNLAQNNQRKNDAKSRNMSEVKIETRKTPLNGGGFEIRIFPRNFLQFSAISHSFQQFSAILRFFSPFFFLFLRFLHMNLKWKVNAIPWMVCKGTKVIFC